MMTRPVFTHSGSSELGAPALVNGNNASDPHFLPVNAAKLTQSLIGLSDVQRQVLEQELDLTDEDPLLVLRFNPNWQGQVAVATVCDAIATFGMRNNARRDAGDGCHRWIFHFDHYQEIEPCRTAIQLAYPEAFALPPSAVATAVAAGAVRANLPTEPLAYAVVINKIAAIWGVIENFQSNDPSVVAVEENSLSAYVVSKVRAVRHTFKELCVHELLWGVKDGQHNADESSILCPVHVGNTAKETVAITAQAAQK